MEAFSNAKKTPGSIISGVPLFSNIFEFYDKNYISILTQALDEVLSSYQREVRARARASWGSLADSITIGFDPVKFEVVFSAAPEAEALEYGDPEHAPSAILRNAAIEASQQLPAKIMAKMSGKS